MRSVGSVVVVEGVGTASRWDSDDGEGVGFDGEGSECAMMTRKYC